MSCNGINRSTMKETKRNKSKLAKATSIKGRNSCRITIKSNGQVGETWSANAVAYLLFGLVVAIGMGYVYSVHSKLLHENELWFSQISDLEREISFRTEAGLYYSYYKQLVVAPTLSQGFYSLIHDTTTESGRTINILKRFNIFQEIVLGTLYRLLSLKHFTEPVYFYINTVFGLHGAYVVFLFCTAWLLSGSLLGGLLACTFFFFNRTDATRLEFAIPLRESFALPFIAAQILFTTIYLRQFKFIGKQTQTIVLGLVFMSSLCVALTWQFAQFVFLLEGLALFAVQVLGIAPTSKVWRILLCHFTALLVVCLFQFFNMMVLASLASSFTAAAGIVFALQALIKPTDVSVIGAAIRTCLSLVFLPILTVAISFVLKWVCNITEDEHIFKFVLAKIGIQQSRDFDSLLYLCQPAFQHLPLDTLTRLSSTLLLPLYLVTIVVLLAVVVLYLWRTIAERRNCADAEVLPPCNQHHYQSISPELAYNLFLSILFGVVALSTVRFKFLWTPHMCVLAAACASHHQVWKELLRRLGVQGKVGNLVRGIGVGLLIAALCLKELPGVLMHLQQLREFYDPDTVELMNWIISTTPKHAVFAGSMQLLAGVKLCTGRSITNHPHFEEKQLRERTVQVYQMYARQSPEDVYQLLSSFGTTYIILEDSICLASPKPNNPNCRLTDIMDTSDYGDKTTAVKHRFCDAVRYGGHYSKHFTLVFANRTFRVYKIG